MPQQVPLNSNIIACYVDLKCIVANNGYSVGDIATAQVTGVQDAFNESDYNNGISIPYYNQNTQNYNYGISTQYNQNTQNFYILVGDIIWTRHGANSGSTGSNVLVSNAFKTTPSQWQIRCTFLYY